MVVKPVETQIHKDKPVYSCNEGATVQSYDIRVPALTLLRHQDFSDTFTVILN